MCNRYGSVSTPSEYLEQFKSVNMLLRFPRGAIPNLEPKPDIRPTNNAPIIRPTEDGLELKEIRWGLIPYFHKKSVKEWKVLTTNARYETVATTPTYRSAYKYRRCLIPFSFFFEWNGPKNARVKWQFTPTQHAFLCFAGIWDKAETQEGLIESYSLVTCPANTDVKDYHDRQPIVLLPDEYKGWLDDGAVPDDKPGILKVSKGEH